MQMEIRFITKNGLKLAVVLPPQSLKAAMSNLDNAEYFNTYGAKATRKNEVVKAIVIGGLLGALFAVIVNVIAHTL